MKHDATADAPPDGSPARWTPERIREFRRRRSWSQEDLAAALGARANTVGRWERGVQDPQRVYCLRLDELDAAAERPGS